MYQLFIDYKKTYVEVRRQVFYNILIEFGIPMNLVRLIKLYLIEMYKRVLVGKNMSDMFPIRNGLKQGDVLSPFLSNFALECTIRRVQVNQDGLKLNGTHQLLAYADDVNILGGSVHAVEENTEALVIDSKENELEVNAEKRKYMAMSGDQNAGRSHGIKTDNNLCAVVEGFKYLGTTLTNRNSIQEEIRGRLKSGNPCYHSVQNLLSSS